VIFVFIVRATWMTFARKKGVSLQA
jgi:hypothetical protein